MEHPNLLMVFVKNAKRGNVKTRLAATLGDDKALEIYRTLLGITLKTTHPLSCRKAVFYSDFKEDGDEWHKHGFLQYVQYGNDLGHKMRNAFDTAFLANYKKVLVVGSDCPALTACIIEDALHQLDENDVVIGPAEDGGYYLLGMKKLYPDLFINKSWSTDCVLPQTLQEIRSLDLTVHLLPTLPDVDEEKDLQKFPQLLKLIKH